MQHFISEACFFFRPRIGKVWRCQGVNQKS